MTRVKKSRTPGSTGTRRKVISPAAQEERSRELKKARKHKGKASGSRQSAATGSKRRAEAGNKTADRRLGSKKAVPLDVQSAPVTPRSKPVTFPSLPKDPEQALEFIESHEQFNLLAGKVEDGISLRTSEQTLFDWFVAQHQRLSEELGLIDEDDQEAATDSGSAVQEGDLLDAFEQGESWLDELKQDVDRSDSAEKGK